MSENREPVFDPFDLNREEFNPLMYMHKLVNSCSFTEIVDREHNIGREIRRLEWGMHSLMYDNYSKFLLGSQTIEKMNFHKMEEDMELLSATMEKVRERCSNLTIMRERQNFLSELLFKQNCLKKLKNLIELTPTIVCHISNKRYQLAVSHYVNAKKLLKSYINTPAVTTILKGAEVAMKDMISMLRHRLFSDESSVADLCESVQLLRHLEEPMSNLQNDFLKSAKRKMDRILVTKEDSDMREGNHKFNCADYHSNFISTLLTTIQTYAKLFFDNVLDDSTRTTYSSLEALEYFVSKAHESFNSNSAINDLLNSNCISEHNISFVHLRREIEVIEKLVPGNAILSLIDDIFASMCIHLSYHILQDAKLSFDSTLHVLHYRFKKLGVSNDLLAFCGYIRESFLDAVSSLHRNLSKFMDSENMISSEERCSCCSVREIATNKVLIPFVEYVSKIALNINNTFEKFSVTFAIVLSYFYFALHATSVGDVLRGAENALSMTPEEISQIERCLSVDFTRAAEHLAYIYTRQKTAEVSRMIRTSLEVRNWMTDSEPRVVRSAIRVIVEELKTANDEVNQLFKDRTPRKREAPVSPVRYSDDSDESNISFNIRNIFADRIDRFEKPALNRSSIMSTILKMSLVSFRELVRLETFGRYGLQQIQIDLHFLKSHALKIVNKQFVIAAVDDIMDACIRRCPFPALMEDSVLNLICYSVYRPPQN